MMPGRPVARRLCGQAIRTLAYLAAYVSSFVAGAEPLRRQAVRYEHAAIAADHPLASRAGIEILQKGGNLVDAAVAVGFALSVVRPESSGVGGGGFMVIWNAERGEAIALDYRERAPSRASRLMYAERGPTGSELSRTGALAAAIPGQVSGLCYALEHYGTLDLKTVLQPAIRLAAEGVPIDEFAMESQRLMLARFAEHPSYRERFAVLYDQYLNQGRTWTDQDRFFSPQRRLLELIAKNGPDAFYGGPVAKAMVAEISHGGGIWSLDDLQSMKPTVRAPLQGMFGGLNVVTMPPPSSGGTALLETLNVLHAYEATHPARQLGKLGRKDSDYVHLLTEAMKHAFADRAEFLGDADFAPVPVARLTSPRYAQELAQRIEMTQTAPIETYGRGLPVEDGGTSHFSLIDADGNAVACTETINTMYGSLVVEPTYGVVLNNEMDDFAALPGEPNVFGLRQSEANTIAPGKRPLSSMTPTIIVQDGKAAYALGASGGPRIISTVIEVLLNMVRFGMHPDAAVEAPRFHHQWLPDELLAEPALFETLQRDLAKRGHSVVETKEIAACQAVSRDGDGIRAGSDPRKGGEPAGY